MNIYLKIYNNGRNMSLNEKTTGISLRCNPQGKIVEVISDDLGITSKIAPGPLFTAIVDRESVDKAFNFLTEIRTNGATFDWPLSVPFDKRVALLHFAGGMTGDNLFIVGARTPDTANHYFDELMKINNEQANALREAMKEQMLSSRAKDRDSQLYDELSKLNNELSTTQRELAKKNIQLEQQQKELKALNKELSATIDELERTRDELVQSEKMASLGRLVSGFAHEINTPIGIAVTAASAINDAGEALTGMLSQDEVSETALVATIDKMVTAGQLTFSNVRRAADLVSSFKRTSIDQTEETKRLFGVSDVIKDVIISLNNKFKNTSITIEHHCPAKINIYGYPGTLSQILNNFLMNSFIHGFDDGTQPGKITIEVRRENNTIYMDYADTGKGMDKETVEKLFEPFYTTRRARGGTGLGMYICFNVITTRLNGTITCESTPGHGTVFHISFPIDAVISDQ
jgi:signal transduction histidine kinase